MNHDLIIALLSNPMSPAHYHRLDRAWQAGQLLPLAGDSDAIACMNAFTSGLENSPDLGEDFQAFDATGIFAHILAGVETSAVDPETSLLWVQRAALSFQPALTSALLDRLPQDWRPAPIWLEQVVSSFHPLAGAVAQVLVDHGLDVAAANVHLLPAARTLAVARVLIDAGADPIASQAAATWTQEATANPGSFGRHGLIGMLDLVSSSVSPAQQLQDLAPLAGTLGPQFFRKQVRDRGLDPSTLLPDGRSLAEHLCLSGLRYLFGYTPGSHAWEQQAISQAKLITWAISRLPDDHPRLPHARAAGLLSHATMHACLRRNFGALLESAAVAKLGSLVGHDTTPESASLVHGWLVRAVDDGLLDNGSTIASSMLSKLPARPDQWLAAQCEDIPETAAMGFLRCAGRHHWDARWQTPSASLRLIVPHYDLLSKIAGVIQDNPDLLNSPSPVLVLAGVVFKENNMPECLGWLKRAPSLTRMDPSDPDSKAFSVFAAQAFSQRPQMRAVLALAQASCLDGSVDQPSPHRAPASPRL